MTTRDEKGRFKKGQGFWTGKKRPSMSGDKNSKWVGDKNNRICLTCGEKFRRAIANKTIPKYCTQKCFAKSLKGKWKTAKNPNWNGGTTHKNQLIS